MRHGQTIDHGCRGAITEGHSHHEKTDRVVRSIAKKRLKHAACRQVYVAASVAATLFVGIASAEEKEPVAVLELGGASAWNVPGALASVHGGSRVRARQERVC